LCFSGVILKNDKHILNNGEILEFLVVKYKFKVEFYPPLSKKVKNEEVGKRKSEDLPMDDMGSNTKRFCNEREIVSGAQGSEKNAWEKIDNGKLYVFTSEGVKSSSKVNQI
jgi:hypothetical protein